MIKVYISPNYIGQEGNFEDGMTNRDKAKKIIDGLFTEFSNLNGLVRADFSSSDADDLQFEKDEQEYKKKLYSILELIND